MRVFQTTQYPGLWKPIRRLVGSLAGAMIAISIAPSIAAFGQDFGDHKSATLAGKAWQALGEGEHDLVAAYTGKCRELYEGEAVKQQASLTGFAPAEQAHSYWALNDVGTCLFIAGESLAQQGKSKEAVAAYKKLVDDFGFCQCWDTKGWFWKPAEAAAGKLKQLEFDAKLE